MSCIVEFIAFMRVEGQYEDSEGGLIVFCVWILACGWKWLSCVVGDGSVINIFDNK